MTDSHTYHRTIGYGADEQCYVVEAKAYGGSIGVRENFLRKCVDSQHAQATPASVFYDPDHARRTCPCHAHGLFPNHRCTPLCSHSVPECVTEET